MIDVRALHDSLALLARELLHGAPGETAYMLNPGDAGLLASLDRLSAAAASAVPPNGAAPIAAHVDHVRYGFELINRWAAGEENPWATADWSGSWRIRTVTDEEWAALRERLRVEAERWVHALAAPREVSPVELNGLLGSLPHLAYHVGAIRQIDRSIRGPAEAGGSPLAAKER